MGKVASENKGLMRWLGVKALVELDDLSLILVEGENQLSSCPLTSTVDKMWPCT